jgi:hypothetical protein
MSHSTNNLLFWNCANGIYNKKASVEKHISFYSPVIFFISEAEIRKNQMIKVLNVPGHKIDVANTLESRQKGRLIAYEKENSGFKRCPRLEHKFNDVLVYSSRDKTVVESQTM